MSKSRVLIVTPLKEEFHLLVEALKQRTPAGRRRTVRNIEVIAFPGISLIVGHGGHGKAQCAAQTRMLLDHLGRIGLVICAGAGGSLRRGSKVGDIVIGTQTVEHDYRLRFVRRPAPVFPGFAAGLDSLKQAISSTAHPFRVHFRPIASGDEDIVTTARARTLGRQTRAACVAWEGAGVARACLLSATPFLEIRCITDSADKAAPNDFHRNLETCMSNLASMLAPWLAGRRPVGKGKSHE